MGITYEQFEEARQRAIDRLKALHYENDPHFMVATGNHEGISNDVCCCQGWGIRAIEILKREISG